MLVTSFSFLIQGALGTPSLVLFSRQFLPHKAVLFLVARVAAPVFPMDHQSVDIAADSLEDLQLQVSLLLVAALHPLFKGGQLIVCFLMRLPIGCHLVACEVLFGVIVPGSRIFHGVVVKLEVD